MKVFTKKAFEAAFRPIYGTADWAYRCLGKTKEQCEEDGWHVNDNYFEEIEEEVESRGEY